MENEAESELKSIGDRRRNEGLYVPIPEAPPFIFIGDIEHDIRVS